MHPNIKKSFQFYLFNIIKPTLASYFPFLYDYTRIKPHFATLNITDNCCFKCVMCNYWQTKTYDELSTEKWKDIFRQLKELGIKEISLSGGEPFLRKDIMELISYAAGLGLDVGVITNGYLLNKEIIQEAIACGTKSFSISIDATGEHFDDIRGVKAAYSKVFNTANLLSEYRNNGVSVDLYFTLMKETLNYYEDVFNLAKRLNLRLVVNLFNYTPYYNKHLEKTRDNFWINKDDFYLLGCFQHFIAKNKNDYPESVYHTYSEIKYFKDYFKDPLQKNIPCIVSQQRIDINSRGEVYGGCWSMGTFGNLKKDTLENILNSSRYKEAHKNMFFKNCPGCSCGYSKNLRYFLPMLVNELIMRLVPITRQNIYE